MNIIIPRDAVAVAMDYRGDASSITAVRYYPELNKIVPQFQLNTNPSSKDFGQWRQIGLARTQANAQVFIADKTKTAKQIWVVTSDRRFIRIWEHSHGVLEAKDIQLAPVVEEVKDENQVN